ncbi:hypothetical protein FHX77_000003 [Bifidobacterium commune]|uniref:DUF4234 domain-containing protein n=1 Tax=Bifidobacterium commune TaxID=1505727 RepID=A0A1C4H0G7_9BIFI|nr:DUF4234 domain-containing protein [Bifidobacterium commune]MBB2954623.1 hypothetical protein [Bifidobacterium commune]SCC78424.1 protein of unknown function [Bifidobacterium commune]
MTDSISEFDISTPVDLQTASQGALSNPGMQQYQQEVSAAPVAQLNTNRSLLKWIFLNIITLGFYGLFVMTSSTDALNVIASRYDGKKTVNYPAMYFVIGGLTLGIGWLVWYHNMSDRIGGELQRRGHARNLSASDFWLWKVLGLLIIVGPFVYRYKYLRAMNELCADYNQRG